MSKNDSADSDVAVAVETSAIEFEDKDGLTVNNDNDTKFHDDDKFLLQQKAKKPRNRSTIVCTNCKKRKTKCDKRHPCLKCISSNKADCCVYSTPSVPLLKQESILRQTNDPFLINKQNKRRNKVVKTKSNIKTTGSKYLLKNELQYPPLNLNFYSPDSNAFNLKLPALQSTALLSAQTPNSNSTSSFVLPMQQKSHLAQMPSPVLQQEDRQSIIEGNQSLRSTQQKIHSMIEQPNNVLSPAFIAPLFNQQQYAKQSNSPALPLSPVIHTPIKPKVMSAEIRSKLQFLTSLVHRLNQLPYFSSIERSNIFNNMMSIINSLNEETMYDDKNFILDSTLWHLSRSTNSISTSIKSQVCPLIYPLSFWGNKDFVQLASGVFEPLLDLYFTKWINTKKVYKVMTDLNVNVSNEEINNILKKLKPFFINNYDAILERVEYYKNHINFLIHKNLVPKSLIDSVIKNFLNLERLTHQIQTHDDFFEISFILSMVHLSKTFDELLPISNFKYTLDNTFENLNDLCIIIINYKNFKQNPNFIGLYATILVTCSTLTFNNNSFAGISGEYIYPIFRDLLSMLFQLGYHLPQNVSEKRREYFKNYSIGQNTIWRIWNKFQALDSILANKLGTPLLINYDYSESYHIFSVENKYESIESDLIRLGRSFAFSLNSTFGSSYRNLLNISNEINEVYAKFDKFKNINNLNDLNRLLDFDNKLEFELKLEALKFIFFANILLTICLKKDNLLQNFPNLDFNSIQYKEVENIYEVSKIRAYLVFIMMMKLIKVLSASNQVDPSILLCIRRMILPWFGFPTLCVLDCIISDSSSNDTFFQTSNDINDQTNKDDIYSTEFDILGIELNELENLFTNEKFLNHCYETKKFKCIKYGKLTAFIINVYDTTKNNSILSENFEFYIKTKILALVIYILLVYSKVQSNPNETSENSLYNVITNVVRQRMRTFQDSNSRNSRESLIRMVLNHDDQIDDKKMKSRKEKQEKEALQPQPHLIRRFNEHQQASVRTQNSAQQRGQQDDQYFRHHNYQQYSLQYQHRNNQHDNRYQHINNSQDSRYQDQQNNQHNNQYQNQHQNRHQYSKSQQLRQQQYLPENGMYNLLPTNAPPNHIPISQSNLPSNEILNYPVANKSLSSVNENQLLPNYSTFPLSNAQTSIRSNQYGHFTTQETMKNSNRVITPDTTKLENQLNSKDGLKPSSNQGSTKSMQPGIPTSIPPEEAIEMVRLFINDDRFTSGITKLNQDFTDFDLSDISHLPLM